MKVGAKASEPQAHATFQIFFTLTFTFEQRNFREVIFSILLVFALLEILLLPPKKNFQQLLLQVNAEAFPFSIYFMKATWKQANFFETSQANFIEAS